MLIPLLNAIYTAFTSNGALISAIPNGLHRDQAPESLVLPYIITHVIDSQLEYSYAGVCRSRVQVRFSVFGVGHDATGTLCETLVTQFDDHLLTLVGSAVNDSVTRLTEPTPKLHRHDAGGNDVWEWSVVYEYGVH